MHYGTLPSKWTIYLMSYVCLFLFVFPSQSAIAVDILDQQEVVDKARFTLATFAGNPNMSWFLKQLQNAEAVFIVPNLLKGSFFFGGSIGNGVFLIRDQNTNAWSDPAFYTMVAGSLGLQIGAQTSEVILLVMTKRGVNSMLTTNIKLGAGATIAVGPVGRGIEGGTTPLLSADLLSFSRSKGVFGGISLEGAVIAPRSKWNHSYYGYSLEPKRILMEQEAHNHYSIGLLLTITKASGGTWATITLGNGLTNSKKKLSLNHGCQDSSGSIDTKF